MTGFVINGKVRYDNYRRYNVEITKEELQKMYNSMSNRDLMKELDVSMPTLMRIIDDAGIERKGMGNAWHKDKIKVVR